MKFILTGTSGFIGTEVLSQCLQNPAITSLIVLSRRELPDVTARDPRIKIVVLSNFLEYPETTLQDLVGATACLWALGGSATNPTPPGKNDEVEVQYAMMAANSIVSAQKTEGQQGVKTRFVFISGILSVRDQDKSLWYLQEGRKARGRAETQLFELAEKNPETLGVTIVRAALVVGKNNRTPEFVLAATKNAIRVDELAAAMIDAALNGNKDETLSNQALRSAGKKLLKK